VRAFDGDPEQHQVGRDTVSNREMHCRGEQEQCHGAFASREVHVEEIDLVERDGSADGQSTVVSI